MTRLIGQLCRVDELSYDQRNEMFALMQRYYDNVQRHLFERDLANKNWVIVAREPASGEVLGFSTQQFSFSEIRGESIGVLFSGDTIVDARYWARNPLAALWGRLALSLIDQYPEHTLVWFLISKGYKTYRYLPVFFNQFFPHPQHATPQSIRDQIDQIAAARFTDRYDPSRGIIMAGANDCRLRPAVADITERRLQDPFVEFFHQQNPGHAGGDELCCLASLSRANLNATAYRVIDTLVATQRQ